MGTFETVAVAFAVYVLAFIAHRATPATTLATIPAKETAPDEV